MKQAVLNLKNPLLLDLRQIRWIQLAINGLPSLVVQTLTTVTLVKEVICKEKLIKGDKYILIKWYQYKGFSAAGGWNYTEYDGQVVCIADLGCIGPYVLKRGKGHSCPSLHSNTLTLTSTPCLGDTA